MLVKQWTRLCLNFTESSGQPIGMMELKKVEESTGYSPLSLNQDRLRFQYFFAKKVGETLGSIKEHVT